MSEPQIESIITNSLTGDIQKNAIEFILYLRRHEMQFERANGYWKSQYYWYVKYWGEYVCYILINGTGSEQKFNPFTIWSDDSDSNCYEENDLKDDMKQIGWAHIDYCEACGCSCKQGTRKIVFGKEFDNVCRTTMRFINPNIETMRFIEKMVLIRKNDIINKLNTRKKQVQKL